MKELVQKRVAIQEKNEEIEKRKTAVVSTFFDVVSATGVAVAGGLALITAPISIPAAATGAVAVGGLAAVMGHRSSIGW